tara:strand:- start:1361 stop:1600 length:240 start_codon:yes stop_codon:yes gene_type:complete
MCGFSRRPSPPPPPPTPAPPATIINAGSTKLRETAPKAPVSSTYNVNQGVAARRRGKRALRIPLDTAFLSQQSGLGNTP